MSNPDYNAIIAGSGPIACTYARIILEEKPHAKILMIEIGSQENPKQGANLKNALKYRKDIDSFVNVIKGALQPVSIPPAESHVSTLGGTSWHPPPGSNHQFHGCNPEQKAHNNLRATAITRTVGGMATHWTCCCPLPYEAEERSEGAKFVSKADFDPLFKKAGELLSVNDAVFNENTSIRHRAVMRALSEFGPMSFDQPGNLPLGVQLVSGAVHWTGSDTVLGASASKITLLTEHRVTKLLPTANNNEVRAVEVYDFATKQTKTFTANVFIIACGAICTPQILWNSPSESQPDWTGKMRPKALGKFLSEQSMAFCQVVLSKADPWHVQVHRDAFSYGEVGPKVDSRVVVDLRFFGKSDVQEKNRVKFPGQQALSDWIPGSRDIYGMPQPTFEVERSDNDKKRDQRMMKQMCEVADKLGGYLPGSYPQFMEPGLALHITGTTRMGTDRDKSVVDPHSRVHGVDNLWLGGNGVIPDSTACNPTITSMAYAIRSARELAKRIPNPTQSGGD